MDPRQAMYDFITGLIDLMFIAWPIVGPFVLMLLVIRVVRWAHSSARGEKDFDDLQEEYHRNVTGVRERAQSIRQYRSTEYERSRARSRYR